MPPDELVPLLAECRRLLRPDGVISSRIDLSDHYSHFDRSLSPYNFLRFSERSWRLFNSALLYQNRLRRPDYVQAFAAAGFTLVSEKAWVPKKAPERLAGLELAERFLAYEPGDLAVQTLRLVARPSPDAPVERQHVGR